MFRTKALCQCSPQRTYFSRRKSFIEPGLSYEGHTVCKDLTYFRLQIIQSDLVALIGSGSPTALRTLGDCDHLRHSPVTQPHESNRHCSIPQPRKRTIRSVCPTLRRLCARVASLPRHRSRAECVIDLANNLSRRNCEPNRYPINIRILLASSTNLRFLNL